MASGLYKRMEVNTPDTSQLGKLISRNASLAGIVTALLLPLLNLCFGYIAMNLLVANEAAIFSNVAKLQTLPITQIKTSLNDLEQLLQAVSINSSSKITMSSENSIKSLEFVNKRFVVKLSNGDYVSLTISRSLEPVFIAAIISLIPGALIGFLVFRVMQAYTRKTLSIAMNELDRRTEAEQRLRSVNSLFSVILEAMADGIVAVDEQGRIVACNTRYLELWGLTTHDQDHGNFMHFTLLAVKVRDPKWFLEQNDKLLRAPTSELIECLVLRDGRFFEWTSRPQRVQDKVVGRISTFRDISESKRAEVLLSTEKTVLEKVVRGVPLSDALYIVADAIERESGDMFCAILFCEDKGKSDLNLVTGCSLPSWYRDQLLALHPRFGRRNDNLNYIDAKSPSRWFESKLYRSLMKQLAVTHTNLEPIQSTDGDMTGLMIAHYRTSSEHSIKQDKQLLHIASQICSIAIDRYRSIRELDLLAHYDFLTGLPNRKHFHDHLKKAIERVQGRNRSLALLFLDLDRFKAVNDSLGHAAGDTLLKIASSRIRESVRTHDFVARLSGDEFVVLIEDLQQANIVDSVARKIADRMTEGVSLNDHEIFISASVGIALYPKDGCTLEELLRNADSAMYSVKSQGRNGVQFFHSHMNEGSLERLRLEAQLRRVLERDELIMHYQPKVLASTSMIISAEALLRWKHPEQGLIFPAKFVSLAEETGLINDFWNWIIHQVCADMVRLDQTTSTQISIAVNISARQFGKPSLQEGLIRAINSTGIDPSRLVFELTESLLMKTPEHTSHVLHELRELGLGGIAIDDFGTGYSSLAYLKRFPITALKIDQSFVSGITYNNQGEAIVKAILALAKSIDLQVTAEGVETLEQAKSLASQGCYELQGYYFGKPVTMDNFIEILRDGMHPKL